MSSAPTDCRVPDPTDAKADGNFGNHRAGYGDRLERIIATARKGWTLAAGEGLALVQEIDRLRKELEIAASMLGSKSLMINGLQDEIDRLRGELAFVSSEAADAYHAIDRRDDELTQQSITLSAEHQRAERLLAALQPVGDVLLRYYNMEASEDDVYAVFCAWRTAISPVTAAEKEVGNE